MGDDFVHGINKMKRPATKVMAPPGGQSQINIFGAQEGPAQHQVNRNQAHRNQSNIFGSPEQKAPPSKPTPTASQTSAPVAPVAAPTSEKSSSITAPPQNPTAPDGGRASTKVMAPPGGKTSINLFG